VPLYGNCLRRQAAAIAAPPPGERRIVLATAIAETSLTIPDVRAIVDSGLARRARFDPATGMTRLVTERLSLASADQRRGRAGRIAPGRCYRLWSEEAHRALPAFAPPEIAVADLAPLALELAAWGNADPAAYALLDAPPAAAYAQAMELLRELEVLDSGDRITPHGRALGELGVHPRLAHMILRGAVAGEGATAAAMAGLLSERDVLRPSREQPDGDLRARLIAFDRGAVPGADRAALARARENAKAWARQAGIRERDIDPDAAGRLLALAYPDRVAQRRGPRGSFRLRNGRGALLAETDALAGEAFLAIGSADQSTENARIFLAAPLTRGEIDTLFAAQIEARDEVVWDPRAEAIAARRIVRLGTLVLEERRLDHPPPDDLRAAMRDGIRQLGLARLPWDDEARQLQARAAFLRRLDGDESALPDLSDSALAADLAWLEPHLGGVTRAAQLSRIDLSAALEGRVGWQAVRRLADEAPTHLTVPTGSRLALDYSSGEPVLAVRLQEMFGAAATPAVARGRVPVTLHLLSPARRPVQVTKDLAGFWARSYADVKKDLKGRYPKHRWPDDPLAAQPTTRAKRAGEKN
jgi:ATP-dependent helicase HrpB